MRPRNPRLCVTLHVQNDATHGIMDFRFVMVSKVPDFEFCHFRRDAGEYPVPRYFIEGAWTLNQACTIIIQVPVLVLDLSSEPVWLLDEHARRMSPSGQVGMWVAKFGSQLCRGNHIRPNAGSQQERQGNFKHTSHKWTNYFITCPSSKYFTCLSRHTGDELRAS